MSGQGAQLTRIGGKYAEGAQRRPRNSQPGDSRRNFEIASERITNKMVGTEGIEPSTR